jgi:hypothetical protein
MRKCKNILCLLLAALTLVASATPVSNQGSTSPSRSVTFAWDPSPSPGVVYFLLGSRSPGKYAPAALRIPCGTNLTRRVDIPVMGVWYFVAVAYKNGTFSDPSNELRIEVTPGLEKIGKNKFNEN